MSDSGGPAFSDRQKTTEPSIQHYQLRVKLNPSDVRPDPFLTLIVTCWPRGTLFFFIALIPTRTVAGVVSSCLVGISTSFTRITEVASKPVPRTNRCFLAASMLLMVG